MLDSYDLWEGKEREWIRWLRTRPICYQCGHHIQEEQMFDINGNYYHVSCAEEEFKKYTDDYIE